MPQTIIYILYIYVCTVFGEIAPIHLMVVFGVYERKCQKSFETIPATQTHTHNKCENAKPIVILNATHTPNSIR